MSVPNLFSSRRVFISAVLALAGCASHPTSPMAERAEALIRDAPDRTGDLRLTCVPSDAEVSVDGVPQGSCLDYSGAPRGLSLGDGMHEIAVRQSGFHPYVTYCAPNGTRGALDIKLRPLAGSEGASR